MDEKEMEELLKGSKREKPSEAVWLRIKAGIEQQQSAAEPVINVWDMLGHFLHAFRPALVTMSLFIVLTAGFLVNNNLSKGEPYMAALMDEDNETALQAGDTVTDSIETYFL